MTLETMVAAGAGGEKTVTFHAEPGLYQFSLFLDAVRFDWESLYQVLNAYHNENERTGPWDFDLPTARPLVPAWWVHLDGRKLGLWYVQRVSLEDVAARRFRGRFAFDVRVSGLHELKLVPYRPMAVEWLAIRLEPDPEDAFDRTSCAVNPPSSLPVAAWSDPAFWSARKRELETTHRHYRPAIEALCDWAASAGDVNHEAIPLLVAAAHLRGRPELLAKAAARVDQALALPAWGRPAEDVYGHNGDIGGASLLRCMAWAFHMLGDGLGAERQARLRARLAVQGERFWEQLLLMRDYWGGSLLQDHGRRAVHDFGTVVMALWGIVPEADRWAAYIVPRIRRGLDSAPLDGVIPGSSYYSLPMYTDGVLWYRDLLLARTGEDLAGHPSLEGVARFVMEVADPSGEAMLVTENDKPPLVGGNLLAETMAAVRRDPAAAGLARLLLNNPAAAMGRNPVTAGTGFLWGFLAHDPSTATLEAPPRPPRDLRWHDDSGFVHYHDDGSGVALAVKCGPWLGFHAARHATGPCDRMEMLPGAGHFSLFVDGTPMLVSPDTGYKLHSRVRSVLLVDGQGQAGDTGYPMSIPSQPPRDVWIEQVRWNAKIGTGLIRLNLKGAYPADLGVLQYTREFLVEPGRRMVCRDVVVLDRPRDLAWLFQFREDMGGEAEGVKASIGKAPALAIEARSTGAMIADIQPTKVVYSYSSAFKQFRHARFRTGLKASSASVDFVLTW